MTIKEYKGSKRHAWFDYQAMGKSPELMRKYLRFIGAGYCICGKPMGLFHYAIHGLMFHTGGSEGRKVGIPYFEVADKRNKKIDDDYDPDMDPDSEPVNESEGWDRED